MQNARCQITIKEKTVKNADKPIKNTAQAGNNNNNNNNPICKAPECQKTSVALKDFRGGNKGHNKGNRMA